jgi:hypothetical protein
VRLWISDSTLDAPHLRPSPRRRSRCRGDDDDHDSQQAKEQHPRGGQSGAIADGELPRSEHQVMMSVSCLSSVAPAAAARTTPHNHCRTLHLCSQTRPRLRVSHFHFRAPARKQKRIHGAFFHIGRLQEDSGNLQCKSSRTTMPRTRLCLWAGGSLNCAHQFKSQDKRHKHLHGYSA